MGDTPVAELESLEALSIFSNCSRMELAQIAASLEETYVPLGTVIFQEGDPGDHMYLIAEGQVRIVSDAPTEKAIFAHLGPGEFFGEMALITGAARSAAAIATTDVRLWRLSKEKFDLVLRTYPDVSIQISRVLGERVGRGNLHRFQNEAFAVLSLAPERDEFTVGRWPENDLVLPDPQVSGVHARIKRVNDRWLIRDEDSASGTYVNRRRIRETEVQDGDEIVIGTHKVFLDGLTVKSFVGREGVRIDALELGRVLPSGRCILEGISLCIYPGELVAIVGGSGTGKTSLLHALNGFLPASSGDVCYNGVSLYRNPGLFRPLIGYVPQDDIVHAELTVERTLYYGAKLRLPKDTRSEETSGRINDVLDAVGLAQRRQTEVKRLSGGERKRVSVALELLANPKALCLDEPTSGLDPALEGRMMGLFRDLADAGTTVLVSTHVTQNLRLCNRIAWMAPGGRLVFFGSPAEALRHFGVQEFGEIYGLLGTPEEREQWSAAFVGSPAHQTNVKDRLQTRPATADTEGLPTTQPAMQKPGGMRQLFWLTLRYAEVLSRDVPNLALLLIQAPAIGLALLFLFSRNTFALTSAQGGNATHALAALQIVTASAIFLGASNAARELTKESAIYARERLVGLGVLPYVASKVSVLSVLCLLQSAVLVGIFAAGIRLPESSWDLYPKLLAAVFVTELAGLSMGLLVSALSANADRAMTAVPLLLIPQLIFAGAGVPLDRMLPPAKIISLFMISRWSLQLAGNITHLGERFSAQLPPVFADPYRNQFEVMVWLPWTVLAAFAVSMLVAATAIQKRRGAL